MKLFVIVLLGVTAVLGQECEKVPNPDIKCSYADENDDVVVVEDISQCGNYDHCCAYNGSCVTCACKDASGSTDDSDEKLKGTLFDETPGVTEAAKLAGFRSLLAFPPGIPSPCLPPPPFPSNCKPTRFEPYVLKPPVNIPYCLRIPCKPGKENSMYDKSHRMCGMQPGCYFDKPLFELREAFGNSVLPGVPVCQLAIRNKYFQTKAQEVIAKFGSWNPYFTNCLLQQFNNEIRKGPVGCPLIPVVETFNVIPKMAGWRTMNSYSCALIDGCWLSSRGCFYPVDISSVRVKSGQRSISTVRKEVVYGRPKCQSFDSSSPTSIVKSYHRCLSAGCSVDYSVTSLYYSHLFDIGKGLSTDQQWKYWGDVQKGLVGPFNIPEVLGEYGVRHTKVATTFAPLTTTTDPFAFPFDLPQAPSSQGVFSPPSPPISSGSTQGGFQCGVAHKLYGSRPCPPVYPPPPKKNAYCGFKPFVVPRFKPLEGSFETCCDVNICYLPKKEISQMHSGPAHYYTEWTTFSECSVTCGVGMKKRYRKCVSEDRSLCTEKLEDVVRCTGAFITCGQWTSWSGWSPCPRSCFPGGNQQRRRRCAPFGSKCTGHDEEARSCNEHGCPGQNGCPGSWTAWQDSKCKYDQYTQRCTQDKVRYCRCRDGSFANNCMGSSRNTQTYPCTGC